MTDTTPILTVLPTGCPSRRVSLELPLATIEELDLLAARTHLDRDQILRQIINAALLSDTPNWPEGPDPVGRLAEHAHLTNIRSRELAALHNREAATGEPRAASEWGDLE